MARLVETQLGLRQEQGGFMHIQHHGNTVGDVTVISRADAVT